MWAAGVTGSTTPVGIVDGGKVFPHQDLPPIEHTGGAWAAFEHSTHVAGLACARQNGVGLVGAAWDCPLISDQGIGGFDTIDAAERVIDAGARVVNVSLGWKPEPKYLVGGCPDVLGASQLRHAVNRAAANGNGVTTFRRFAETVGKDVVFTLSAGNLCVQFVTNSLAGADDLPNVITVSSVNQDGQLSAFSNWGAEVASGGGAPRPDFGNDLGVWSTLPGNQYGQMAGTSMAAPIVAGSPPWSAQRT